jgi:hypothetical protein
MSTQVVDVRFTGKKCPQLCCHGSSRQTTFRSFGRLVRAVYWYLRRSHGRRCMHLTTLVVGESATSIETSTVHAASHWALSRDIAPL